jgi:hypothetical protein
MQEISSILNSKLSPIMIFILVLLVVILYYFHKPISAWFTSLIKRKEKVQDIKSLRSHDIFNTLQRVKQEVSHMKFYTHGVFDANKSRMCSDFAKFKCNVCTDKFLEFLDNDFSKINSDELKQLMLKEMWGMHAEYIKQIRSFWLEKGIKNQDVDYVIELFEKFRYDVVVSFQNRIDGIFASSYHKNNFDKILACYEMYAMGIDLLAKDMLTTFEALNGRFTNINYI